ncbi:MAG: SUMF1/EgtB/PvdO family nonheme iron enzyme [Pirellulales bacterium]
MRIRTGLFLLLAFALPANDALARKWTDRAGEYQLEAEFVDLADDGQVRLRKPTGEIVLTPLEKFGDADREYIRQFARTGKPPGMPERLVVNLGGEVKMAFVLVPAGEFTMGSPESEPSRQGREGPVHAVRITRPFYLGTYEVTQAEYEQVVGKNPSWLSPSGKGKDRAAGLETNRFPVEMVSWNDATAFCRRMSSLPAEIQAGRVHRLPTEAEWEYACRADTRTAFCDGDSLSSTQANCDGRVPYGAAAKGPYLERTSRVGSYKPNAWGLYDLHGNVWEWCADWYGENYYRDSPAEDPPGPNSGDCRVLRGGSWYSPAASCRSAFRAYYTPTVSPSYVGFRVLCQPRF